MDFVDILQTGLRAGFGSTAAVFALAAIGLNIHYGYTGLRNFGVIGFMLVGAYGYGVSVSTWDLNWWVGILIGLGAGVLLAVLLGAPTLRLRSDYFAITTIAAAEILRYVFRSRTAEPVTGGPFGLQSLANDFNRLNPMESGSYGWGKFSYTTNALWPMIVIWGLVLLCTGLVFLLMRSPWGRVIRSIREDEDVARAMGKNVFSYKMQSLVLGGVIMSLAGVMWALSNSTVNPTNYQPQQTFYVYTILILGGAATRVGPIVGSIIFWTLFQGSFTLLSQLNREDLLPGVLAGSQSQGALSIVLIGIGLVALMAFRPQGIFGDKREMALDD
jgi:neutral amino acid transport system permease protein